MNKIKSISVSDMSGYKYESLDSPNREMVDDIIIECINSLEGTILQRDLIISLPKLEDIAFDFSLKNEDILKIQIDEGIDFSDLLGLINRLNNYVGQGIEEYLCESLNVSLASSFVDGLEFYRNSSQFPDLFLIDNNTKSILLSIELKSWFVFSGDEITARFHTSPDAIPDGSLLIIYPWLLDRIISGSPLLLAPHIADAKELALKRDSAWHKEGVKKVDIVTEDEIKSAINKIRNKSVGMQWNDKLKVWEPESDNFSKIWRIYDDAINIDFYSKTMQYTINGRTIASWRTVFSLGLKIKNLKKSTLKQSQIF